MFKALRDDAATLVSALWQCGLTTTLHLRQGLTVAELSEISCAQSELYKASDQNASDSFPAFALKALLMAPSGLDSSRLKILKDWGIKYNGAVVNKVRAIATASHHILAPMRTTCHHDATHSPPRHPRTVTAQLRGNASTRLPRGRHARHAATTSPPDMSPAGTRQSSGHHHHRSQAMMAAIVLFEEKINSQAVDCLQEIEHIAGRPVLTLHYNKLLSLCRTCTKIAEASKAPDADDATPAFVQSCVLWACQALRFGLRYEMIKPGEVTGDSLEQKTRGSSEQSASLPHIWLARRFLLLHVAAIVEDVRGLEDAGPLMNEFDDVMQNFVDYPKFERAFKNSADTPVAAVQEEGDHLPESTDACDQLDELLQKYQCKPTSMVANFLFDLLSGVLDDRVKAACEGCKDNLRDIDYASKPGMEALRDLKRALGVYKTVVPASLPGAATTPGPSAATPGRSADADAVSERDAVWQRATAKRKAMAVVGHGRITSKQQAQAFYERCSTVYRYQPKDKEAHRVFLFSAELYSECRNAPWSNPAPYDESAKPLLEFMLAQAGVGDVLVFMDGRSKAWRRKIEDMVEQANARHVAEVWIVYKLPQSAGAMETRKKSWSSDNREVALVSMCLPRNHMPVKPRADPCRNAGESSTHYTTYTGVEPMTYHAMQLVSKSDKEKIFGYAPEMPKLKSSGAPAAGPLLWQERKTPGFWGSLLTDLEAKAVFDLTPGAGVVRPGVSEPGDHVRMPGQKSGAQLVVAERAGQGGGHQHLRDGERAFQSGPRHLHQGAPAGRRGTGP